MKGRWQRAPASDDGLPIPPPLLRARVAGNANAEWFLTTGRKDARIVADVMRTIGAPLEAADGILDFGCGCGRVVRHWMTLGSRIHGSDHEAPAIAWCRRNLPFGSFTVNRLEPPLGHADASYDLVSAISVFTHTPEPLQRPWLRELVRVLRPGGHVLFTTHGDLHTRSQLVPDEVNRLIRDGLVVRDEYAGGTNLCAAFHSESYVRDTLGEGLEEVAFRPGNTTDFTQDIWVFRKPRSHAD